MNPVSFMARGTVVVAVVMAWLLAVAVPVYAHVTIDSVLPQGDGTVELVFAFEHACVEGGAAGTTGVTIEAPEDAAVIAVGQPDGWTHVVDRRTIELAGPAVPDGERAEFVVTARIDGEPGHLALFPAVQSCADGTRAEWTDEASGAESPAPGVLLSAATIDPGMAIVAPPAPSRGANGVQVAVAAVGFVALVTAAAAAFTRRRHRSKA